MHPYIGMKCPVLSLLCPVLQIQTFLKLIIICADYTADKDLTLTVNGVVQSQTYEYASMVTVNAEESQNGDQIDNLKLENVGSNGIVKVSSKLTTSGGLYSYTLSMGSSSRTKNVYASGYITYSNNATGEVLTKYTEVYTSSAS